MDETSVTPSAEPVCPYCGEPGATGARCGACRGPLDPLSRQRTQNEMGPWFVRDPQRPFRPGCSHPALAGMIRRGVVTPESVVRGPTTRQFWRRARDTPGVAHFFGACHNCYAGTDGQQTACSSCGASFVPEGDRDHLGLAPVRPLPGDPQPTPAPAPKPMSGVPATPARAASEPAAASTIGAGQTETRRRTLPVWVWVMGTIATLGGVAGGVVGGVPQVRRMVLGHEPSASIATNRPSIAIRPPESADPPPLPESNEPEIEPMTSPVTDEPTEEVPAVSTIKEPAPITPDQTKEGAPLLGELASLAIETDIEVLNRRVRAWMGEGGEAERVAIRRLEQLRLGRLTGE